MSTTFPIYESRPARLQARDSGAALGRELCAIIPDVPRAGIVWAFFTAFFTLGLYPAIIWPLRFRHLIDVERFRLGRLAQWVEARETHPGAPRLRLAADGVRFRPVLYLIGFGSCAVSVGVFFAIGGRVSPNVLWHDLYSSHPMLLSDGQWLGQLLQRGAHASTWALRNAIFTGWVIGLSIAFCTHWAQVQLHARSVRQFLDEFNKIAIDQGLSPVFLAPVGSGLGVMSAIGAFVMASMNAPWGIPLMLAGSIQHRYVTRVGPSMHKALATRVRDMALLPHPIAVPARAVPKPARNAVSADRRLRCTTEGCRLPLPAGARFCPRCGRRAAPAVDRVA